MTQASHLRTLTNDTLRLRDQLAAGEITAADLTEACIASITAREPDIKAWVEFDPDRARQDAARLDDLRESGAALGPLHGLPVGVKDIIDTAGIPTRNGCALDQARIPTADAEVVSRLKAAGAIMFGKTVTTELAFLHPNKTRNPHNIGHTPGGSSSGSAAAVADGMVPLAIGTQTGGSVIRPASFCGVTGFKPSLNAIPRDGVLMQSHSLDTVGVFAADPAGAALLANCLMEPTSVATRPRGARGPVLAWLELPGWSTADPELKAGLARLRAALGDHVVDIALPTTLEDAAAQRARINTAEMGHYYRDYLERGADLLGPPTRSAIAEGLEMPAHVYLAAKAFQAEMAELMRPIFDKHDAILCPAAPGPAPKGLGSTGDAIFNGLWTMAGTPAITLPLLKAANGLPMGVQLVGPVGGDAELVGTAEWLWDWAATPEFAA